ncbi:MAG: MlaC/ttg2D family ABC transporter substrate-binding protein, partial [Nitrospiraceae bacterium]
EDRIVRLTQIADARFDYAERGKRSLGAHWKKLSDREQQQFVELFTELLTATYADKIDSYSGERVKYLDERREGENYAEVRTKMIGKKTEIPVNYRLIKKDDAWQAYDVVIDGVSLVKNYRGQFASILRSSSFEQLVEALREKIKTYQDPTKLSKSHASTRQN